MKNIENEFIEIFCHIDDFNQIFINVLRTHQVTDGTRKLIKSGRLDESEIMTIVIYFHLMHYRDFKHYYLFHVCKHMQSEFPGLLSYYRFVKFMQKVLLSIAVFLFTRYLSRCTGISFVDSTPISASYIKLENSNKTLKVHAIEGSCSIGWFFGLMLNFIIKEKSEMLFFILTPVNVDNIQPLTGSNQLTMIFRRLFRDKEYIFQSLFEKLFIDILRLITKLRTKLNNSLMFISDKTLFRKKSFVESVFDDLNNICQINNIRNRNSEGFIINLLSG